MDLRYLLLVLLLYRPFQLSFPDLMDQIDTELRLLKEELREHKASLKQSQNENTKYWDLGMNNWEIQSRKGSQYFGLEYIYSRLNKCLIRASHVHRCSTNKCFVQGIAKQVKMKCLYWPTFLIADDLFSTRFLCFYSAETSSAKKELSPSCNYAKMPKSETIKKSGHSRQSRWHFHSCAAFFQGSALEPAITTRLTKIRLMAKLHP